MYFGFPQLGLRKKEQFMLEKPSFPLSHSLTHSHRKPIIYLVHLLDSFNRGRFLSQRPIYLPQSTKARSKAPEILI